MSTMAQTPRLSGPPPRHLVQNKKAAVSAVPMEPINRPIQLDLPERCRAKSTMTITVSCEGARCKTVYVCDFTSVKNQNGQVPAVGSGDTGDTWQGAGQVLLRFHFLIWVPVPHVFDLCKSAELHT